MIHDLDLCDRLSELGEERFDGTVFRATRVGADPVAPSVSGGRWAPPASSDVGVPVLYTSLERDGALAEVAAYLVELIPIPGPRPLQVTRLAVSTGRTLRLARASLESLGVRWELYGTRDYGRTQEVGSALAFLGFDGLIAPSARWSCDNLVIFSDNHPLTERLEPLDTAEVEWRGWARDHGFIDN